MPSHSCHGRFSVVVPVKNNEEDNVEPLAPEIAAALGNRLRAGIVDLFGVAWLQRRVRRAEK